MNMMKQANQFHPPRVGAGPISVASIGLDDETWEFVKRFAEAVPIVRLRPPLPTYHQEDVPGWIGNSYDRRDRRIPTQYAEQKDPRNDHQSDDRHGSKTVSVGTEHGHFFKVR